MSDSTKKKVITVRLSDEAYRAADERRSRNGHKFHWLLETYLAAYATGDAPLPSSHRSPTAATPETAADKPYPKATLPWHNKLELVLADPEQGPALQQVLDWAAQTVLSKSTQTRPAGKRAVGE
jgi:hypothetical protein